MSRTFHDPRSLRPRSRPYWQVVRRTRPANLIAYWPLWEPSGTTATDLSGNGRNGTYTGVTLGQPGIGDGRTAPFFDGVNDFVNIHSASLQSAFNPSEGTLLAWVRVANADVWTDAAGRRMVSLTVDANNFVVLEKPTNNNQVNLVYRAGSVTELVAKTAFSPTDWFVLALTWSVAAGEVKGYVNGTQEGTTQTGLGTWVGNLNAATTTIGASSTTPSGPWHGYLAHVALWNTPLSATEIAKLARVT